ncbi:hypothetical protein Tco_0958314 [Tanacetum coccineum]
MAEFLRLSNFKGCKVAAGTLLPPGAARVTHLAPPTVRLEDIPPKTGDMIVAEISCRKVIDDKEKKKRKAVRRPLPRLLLQIFKLRQLLPRTSGGKVLAKKRRVRVGAQAPPDSEHVSSPTPLNQAKLWRFWLTRRMFPLLWGKGNADASHALEGHGDNEGGLSGPQIHPSLIRPSDRHRDILKEPAPEKFVPDAEASALEIFLLLLNRGLQTQVVWTTRVSQDMMANLFTPTDEEFLNEGVRDESTIRWSWKMLCQSAQQQANVLLRFEALKEQHADLVYTHESCTNVKACFKECRRELATVRLEELEEEKKEADNLNSSQADRIKQLEETLKQAKADAEQLRSEKVHYVVEARKGEIVRQKIVNQYLPTFVRRLHQKEDVQAILKATPNVDPTSSETFLPAYEKLFDQRYPYADKVARMYLLDPTELQNIMPNETGPTPGGGPHDTPMASYA